VENANDPSRLGDFTELSRQQMASKMIEFFDPLFDTRFLDSEHIDRIRHSAGNEAVAITREFVFSADHFRRKLGVHEQRAAWLPNIDFEVKLAQKLGSIWTPSLKHLGGPLRDSLLVAAASYKPVRQTFDKRSKDPNWGLEALKWGWRGVKAFKTMGFSLIIDGGRMLLKGGKEKEEYDQFTESVTDALNECRKLRSEIDRAKACHRVMLSDLGSKLSLHLLFSLADYYGPASTENKLNLATSIAEFSSVSPWKDRRYRETGIQAMKARKRRLFIFIGVLVVASFTLLGTAGIFIVVTWFSDLLPPGFIESLKFW